MELYNNGMVSIVQDSKENVKRVREVMDEFGFDDIRIFGDGGDGITFIGIEDYPGNIDDEMRKAAEKLHGEGIDLWGEYRWRGDYDGFAIINGDRFDTFDIEYYALEAGDDSSIIGELKDRGYDVSSLMEQWKERHDEGKDKVVPF